MGNAPVISVACDSGSEIQTAFQAVNAVVRTQIHHIDDVDELSMFPSGLTWQGGLSVFELDPGRFGKRAFIMM